MKTLRKLAIIILVLGLLHVGNTAFWYFLMERDISEIPFYIENFGRITLILYLILSLIIYVIKWVKDHEIHRT
ncbi:hypothetical protein DS745_03755 [Anaerobacillus alkaliphilus]|uniref:Uncharacterized protein n=1 Tax=Anaerobacillus alkaliphilus TaxID=1548597 RepID=A0A4Q0VZU2_9BACI|nr:hypothetical protein [Anaerobacillus alkaliphilus]RXJ04508.1 hypothetical protein DS745_03755 [Anaerobacillus alkaliphilus]